MLEIIDIDIQMEFMGKSSCGHSQSGWNVGFVDGKSLTICATGAVWRRPSRAGSGGSASRGASCSAASGRPESAGRSCRTACRCTAPTPGRSVGPSCSPSRAAAPLRSKLQIKNDFRTTYVEPVTRIALLCKYIEPSSMKRNPTSDLLFRLFFRRRFAVFGRGFVVAVTAAATAAASSSAAPSSSSSCTTSSSAGRPTAARSGATDGTSAAT